MCKVISFGLWGADKKYTHGAILNAELATKYYPDYVCRFYIDDTVPDKILNRLESLGAEISYSLDACTSQKRYYRLSIMIDDPSVSRFIIRDCDSRIGAREVACLREWERSAYPVHIIRDHPKHTAPIMGGMWGAVDGFIQKEVLRKSLRDYTFKLSSGWRPIPHIGKPDGDQNYLLTKIWPKIKDNHLAHVRGKKLLTTDKEFSIPLKDKNFVGQIYNEHNVPQCEVNR